MSEQKPWTLAEVMYDLIQDAQNIPQLSNREDLLMGLHEIEQEYVNAERRKAKAEALRDAADMLYEYQWPPGCGRPMGPPDEQAGWMHGADDAHELFDRLLRDRADRIEEDQ